MPNAALNSIVLIPARLAATRLPDKPLADIHGTPMIIHALRAATKANIGPVVVACDGAVIAELVTKAGGTAVITDPALPSGSDRIYAALTKYDPEGRYNVVINLQGDLPNITPSAVARVLDPLLADTANAVAISTIAGIITRAEEKTDPNVVKAIGTEIAPHHLRAFYFTRATAPSGDGVLYHHIGLYAFRRQALERFVTLPASTLEKRERLEQLRAMEDGMRIDIALVDDIPVSVDTPDDLARARALMA